MSDERWFVTDGESQSGPLPLERLREELARPSRGLARMVWREGMADWTSPDLVPELAAPAPPPEPPEPREPLFMTGMKDPRWFMVGGVKLAVMIVVTLGFYQIYWFYKQWDRVRDAGENVAPAPRSLFSLIFCYSLFRRIVDSSHSAGVPTSVPAWLLTAGFILPNLLWRYEGTEAYLGFLGIVPMVAAQRIATAVAIAQGSTDDRNTRLTWRNWAWIGALVGLFALIVVVSVVLAILGHPLPAK